MSDSAENIENVETDGRVTKPFKFVTCFDSRFPQQNQTKHCWQTYVDYHRCVNAKGEDFAPCEQFKTAFRIICPSSWVENWDAQREKGNFPAKLNE